MSDLIERCEAGCMAFDGGERTHHVDCVFYPESLTKMHADALAAKDKRIAELEAALREVIELAKPVPIADEHSAAINGKMMIVIASCARQALAQED